jgi:hypothetical protein
MKLATNALMLVLIACVSYSRQFVFSPQFSPHTVHVLSKHVVAEIIMSPHTVHVLSKHVVAEIKMSPHTVHVLSKQVAEIIMSPHTVHVLSKHVVVSGIKMSHDTVLCCLNTCCRNARWQRL